MAKRAPKRATRTRTRRSTARPTSTGPDATARDAGREFQRLVGIMQRLRSRTGCPWDREQTLATLRPFVLEETYEVLQAIDAGDLEALRGEIGDFRFTVAHSLRDIIEKLIRRHPHVFGTRKGVHTPGQVLEQWEQIKSREQRAAGRRKAVLAGLPKTLPALLGAHEIGTRVAAVGFDWARTEDVVMKIKEEVSELERAVGGEGRDRVEEEMGDLLFSIANLARKLGVEPESALRKANQKFAARFDALETHLETRGHSVHEASLDEMEEAWGWVKSRRTRYEPSQ
jgi:tetrapyrrole methylase family protein/MazG family protein/ATP diphosphatase